MKGEGMFCTAESHDSSLPKITWYREIPGFPGYLASSQSGLIISLKPRSNRFRNPQGKPNFRFLVRRRHPRWAYWRVDMRDADCVKQTIRVAQCVAWAWLGSPPPDFRVCHADGDEDNNDATNFYYGTHTDNMLDLAWHKRHGKGTIRPQVDVDDASTYLDDAALPVGIFEVGYDAELGF